MKTIKTITGLPLELREAVGYIEEYIVKMNSAMAGDMVITLTPATLASSAAAVNAEIALPVGKFVRTVAVELKNAAGEIHDWFTGTLSLADAEVTNGNGTGAVTAATVAMVNGVGVATLEYIGVWAAADTQTLTVTGTVMGNVLAAKTSVDTLGA